MLYIIILGMFSIFYLFIYFNSIPESYYLEWIREIMAIQNSSL